MDDPFPFLIIFLSLFFSAFFSGMEIAFISSDKLHIEVLRKKGGIIGRILSLFSANQSQLLATLLVGNSIALVVYGIYMAEILESSISEWIGHSATLFTLIVQSILSTILVLVIAEFIPKSVFMINPDVSIRIFALPMFLVYLLFFPVVSVVVFLSSLVISITGSKVSDEKPVFGLTDLNNYIKRNILNEEEEEESEVDTKILNNAIEFKTVKVRECMIPRTEIEALEVNSSIHELTERFTETGHSKILIYKDSIDDVVGYCHALELFKKPANIKSILSAIPIVPETMLANELLVAFISDRRSLALVVDEYGGTSGVVSIEDVIEEIFGEIRDEHDDEYLLEEKMDAFNYRFSARHEVDYLNDKYNLGIPEGEYDTLGGFIIELHENLPDEGEVIEIAPFVFTILSKEENRINNVKLTLNETEDSSL